MMHILSEMLNVPSMYVTIQTVRLGTHAGLSPPGLSIWRTHSPHEGTTASTPLQRTTMPRTSS